MTPMLKQYYDLKASCPEFILFFRMGDFYELFGDDASFVAPKLQIVLTSRDYGSTEKIPFCGVPHHSAKAYWLKLLRQGYKIAIADQVEDPATAKGLVRREITKYLTPGCIDEWDQSEDSGSNNFLCLILENPECRTWCVIATDLATGDLLYRCFDRYAEMLSELLVLNPSEVLCRSFVREKLSIWLKEVSHQIQPVLTVISESNLRNATRHNELIKECFGDSPLSPNEPHREFILDCVGTLLEHVKSLNFSLDRFLSIKSLISNDHIELSPNTIKDLELFFALRRQNVEGSLYREINRCQTSLGQRLLQNYLCRPLADQNKIEERHLYTSMLFNNPKALNSCRVFLKKISDIKRLATRMVSKQIRPEEFALLFKSLEAIKDLSSELNGSLKYLGEDLKSKTKDFEEILVLLQKALRICSSNNQDIESNFIFNDNYDPQLKELIYLTKNGEKAVSQYESLLRDKTGIHSLKIKAHKSFGLMIEITKSHLAKVPSYFIRKQSMVNCERFITDELIELDNKLSNAQIQAQDLENQLYAQLIQACCKFKDLLHQTAELIAQLDVLQSFAFKALEAKYTKPTISKKRSIELVGCRHPVVEAQLGRHAYEANSISLSENKSTMLITGPNMAGKSTVMRQVAIAAIMNQIGSFVAAETATLPIFDQIFTRIGASDDLAKGQSTFMVEMSESAFILRKATQKSLVIVDEVGRGTSTKDGIAIAAALLEAISKTNKSFCLFATHFYELIPFAESIENLSFFQTEAITSDQKLKFTHRLIPGISKSSFGIEVAKLAGVPSQVVERARNLLHLSATPKTQHPPTSGAILETPNSKTSLSTVEHLTGSPIESEICSKIRQLRLNRITPIHALNLLFELQEQLKTPHSEGFIFESAERQTL